MNYTKYWSIKMELNEAIKILKENGVLVEAAMPEATKAVRKADDAIFNAETLKDVITALQKLDAALPDMDFYVEGIAIRLKHPKNQDPWIEMRPRENDSTWYGVK